jgi:catechol 2,3-dioxygenase-like lactoylglutathione lyase family enzyme
MLDHITISVRDLQRAKGFYDQALRPLGIECLYTEEDGFAGYGVSPKAFFWIGHTGTQQTSVHVAFTAEDRRTVDRFYEEALKAGGQDNGPPGIRAHYHPNYYGAFVFDPDGHNIEAVCHSPSAQPLT